MDDSGSPRSLVRWGVSKLGRNSENRDFSNYDCGVALFVHMVRFVFVYVFTSNFVLEFFVASAFFVSCSPLLLMQLGG